MVHTTVLPHYAIHDSVASFISAISLPLPLVVCRYFLDIPLQITAFPINLKVLIRRFKKSHATPNHDTKSFSFLAAPDGIQWWNPRDCSQSLPTSIAAKFTCRIEISLTAVVTLCCMDLTNTREGHVLISEPFVSGGGLSADSIAVRSSVTEKGNFGKKKRLDLLSRIRCWEDDTQRGDSPPVKRRDCCNVSRAILLAACTLSLQREVSRLPQFL
jgi:hypothetical protein